MGFFNRKPKVVKEISGGVWGYLVSQHNFDVDTLARDIRCVEKPGVLDEKGAVTFLRIFRLSDAERKDVTITGWEIFDEYPELLLLEGYLTAGNTAYLERIKP